MSRDNVPGYQRVIDAIHADIEAGRLVPGDQLPTAAVLAKQHEVGITTVRYAINILIVLGVLRGRQGVGVFIEERRDGGSE